jgi:hypothetical protein
MFVGAINSTLRTFLAHHGDAFRDRVVMMGCSGNFTCEATLTAHANPFEIHSNDVSLYSTLLGRWLTGEPFQVEIVDPDFDWLRPYFASDLERLGAVMVLLDMLPFVKQNNPHAARMWGVYRESFPGLVAGTIARLQKTSVRITSYFCGDVLDHFQQHDTPGAVFLCYAPTYTGGYERMFKRLGEIFSWDEPTYPMLDEDRRAELLSWMSARRYVYYDDRLLEGYAPVLQQNRGRMRTVYLYSNVIDQPALFAGFPSGKAPRLPLVGPRWEATPDAKVTLKRMNAGDLAHFKDMYLSKDIDHAMGSYAVQVWIGIAWSGLWSSRSR